MNCEAVEEFLPAHALGALEGEDAAAVEKHLKGCPTCRLALDGHRLVVLNLPETVPQIDPPADLKGRLMARIDALSASAVAAKPLEAPGVARRWFGFPGQRRVQVLIASLSTVSLFLVGWAVFQTLEVNDLRDDNVEMASEIRKQWDTLAFATADGVQTVQLVGTEVAPMTKGSLLMDLEENKAILMVTGLTPPPKGMTYQLWLWKHETTPASLGTFGNVRNGYVMWRFQSPISLVANRFWGVTMEPRGGSEQPTGELVLAGEGE